MPTSESDLKKLAALAYLDINDAMTNQLATDLSSIMHLVDQLLPVNTSNIKPLLHPLDLNQRLRADTVTEGSMVSQLENRAPLFANGLYLVPTVIGK
jgi:aspartyl-tRNA(Asn)/glutamyl-tRNA(Gln) amidotransferase subunit C